MLTDLLKAYPQYLISGHLISWITRKITHFRHPVFLKNILIRLFIRLFRIDLDLAKESSPNVYPHFNAFFTRELRTEARPIDNHPLSIVSPVDGCISQMAPIESGTLIQAKGHHYRVVDLLGGDGNLAQQFANGLFTTIYLSPRDYHRIHIPVAGKLEKMIHVPGRLFSVNPATVRTIPRLFARNERVISIFSTEFGAMAMVKVGAINVSSIETVWAGEVTPPMRLQTREWDYSENETPITFNKGDEIARFNMGSTVILLFADQDNRWLNELQPEVMLNMGEKIGFLDR